MTTLISAVCATSGAYGTDDTPAGAGLHLRIAPLTRGVVPNGRFVMRFSVNYSGPGRSGDIVLTFVATDSHSRKLKPQVTAAGLRLKRPYVSGATSMLVNGVSSRGTRVVKATFTLRADGKICVRGSQACSSRTRPTSKPGSEPCATTSSRTDDEEGNRHVLTGHADDCQRVEQLVVAEHCRSGIRSAPRVDHCSGGVGKSSDDQ